VDTLVAERGADLADHLARCSAELHTVHQEIDDYLQHCRRHRLLVADDLLSDLAHAALVGAARVDSHACRLGHTPGPDRLALAESVLRFGLSTLAYARGALEWCSPSYAQSRTVQFFDTRAQNSSTVNYERYEHAPLTRVESQLLDVLGLSDKTHAVSVTSSGVAAYTLIESFLVRERLRPGDVVLTAPYLYFEASEQLSTLPFVEVVRSTDYDAATLVAEAERLQPRCVFVDPIANTASQRMVDLPALLAGLRSVARERTTVVIDGTLVSAAVPPSLLASDDRVEVLYYESCSKYAQLGLDAGMAGLAAYPLELRDAFLRQRRNTGAILYRHGAELFPRYDAASYHRRMDRIAVNARRLAALLQADPRVRAAGRVYHPNLANHPDHAAVGALRHTGGCVTFLHHDPSRNTRESWDALFDVVLARAADRGVHLTKGASFGFATPRISAADAFDGQPPFLRLYAGDRGEQIAALADIIGSALAESDGSAH
jgi:cystathionine gamma-synthase